MKRLNGTIKSAAMFAAFCIALLITIACNVESAVELDCHTDMECYELTGVNY
jgi:hypothetical protein